MADGRVQLAEKMITARSYGPAINVLQQHLRQQPDDARARSLLGLAAYRSGDDAAAVEAFRAVLAIRPDDVPTLYNLGRTLERLGRVTEARPLIERAATLGPTYRPAVDWLARSTETPPGPHRPDPPGSHRPDPPGPAAPTKPGDDPERLTAGTLLHSGTRRLSSFLGVWIIAALLALTGLLVLGSHRPGRLQWMGEALTFPSPSFLAEVLDKAKGGPLEAQAQADYDRAVAQATALADRIDSGLLVTAGILIVLGLLLLIRSLIAAPLTRYDLYQRRIDITRGVLNRHHTSAWLFEIQDVRLRQPPWLTLSRNAEIRIRLQDSTKLRIIGLGTLRQQIRLREELRDAALRERRALKSVWV